MTSATGRCFRCSFAPRASPKRFSGRLCALTIEGIRRVVHSHGEQIGLSYLRPHDLRRTLAGTLDARDIPIQDIRVVLRHETLAVTHIYLGDNPLRANRQMRSFTIDLAAT